MHSQNRYVVATGIELNSDIIHCSDTGSDVDRNKGFGTSSKSLLALNNCCITEEVQEVNYLGLTDRYSVSVVSPIAAIKEMT